MTRVKGGVNALKTRRKILKQVKGFRFSRSKKEKAAYEALQHAGAYSFAHRRDKKGDFRNLWQIRLGAVLRTHDISYSKFMGNLRKANINLNRKVLSEIAAQSPATLETLVKTSAR